MTELNIKRITGVFFDFERQRAKLLQLSRGEAWIRLLQMRGRAKCRKNSLLASYVRLQHLKIRPAYDETVGISISRDHGLTQAERGLDNHFFCLRL